MKTASMRLELTSTNSFGQEISFSTLIQRELCLNLIKLIYAPQQASAAAWTLDHRRYCPKHLQAPGWLFVCFSSFCGQEWKISSSGHIPDKIVRIISEIKGMDCDNMVTSACVTEAITLGICLCLWYSNAFLCFYLEIITIL